MISILFSILVLTFPSVVWFDAVRQGSETAWLIFVGVIVSAGCVLQTISHPASNEWVLIPFCLTYLTAWGIRLSLKRQDLSLVKWAQSHGKTAAILVAIIFGAFCYAQINRYQPFIYRYAGIEQSRLLDRWTGETVQVSRY
jgi:hypothetical protein